MSWPVATVGEVCEVVSGATPRTGTPEFWDGNVPCVTPKDVSELGQKHLSDTPRKITKAGLKSCSARMLPAQSVLFSSRAPIGLVAINTLSVIEQLTYLLFIKRLDELHTREEHRAARTGHPIAKPLFTARQNALRWSRFKELAPERMFETVRDRVFPFIKSLGRTGDSDEGSTYTHHMKDAFFMMPTARVLANVVDQLDDIDILALFLRLLQTGGRAAVIVPDGVLFGSSKAHRALRRVVVEEQKLDAIVSMPSGVFRPYAGVSTAILLFTKTNSGGTDDVWFYDMQADGYSLDDKRTPQPEKSDLADILARWRNREAEHKRARTDQSFLVPKAEIASNEYDLSINRYKEVYYEAVEYDPPMVILKRLGKLEAEIAEGQVKLEGMLR